MEFLVLRQADFYLTSESLHSFCLVLKHIFIYIFVLFIFMCVHTCMYQGVHMGLEDNL